MRWKASRIVEFIRRTLIEPLMGHLREGITPEKLALSTALGLMLGIFPVVGITTVLCTVAAVTLRLNLPAIQLVNYFVTPLQFLLFIPFIRFGEQLFGASTLPMDISRIVSMFQMDLFGTINVLWLSIIHAVAGWILVAPFLTAAVYYILVRIFSRMTLRSQPAES